MEKIQGCEARWVSLLSGRGSHLSFSERKSLTQKISCERGFRGTGETEDYSITYRWVKKAL